MDSEIAQKYQQIKDLSSSTEHATKYNQVFLVENKQSKEVCVLKHAQKTIGWYKQPNRQNKLMNVRHNNLVKIIEMQDTEDYFIVVEELSVNDFVYKIFYINFKTFPQHTVCHANYHHFCRYQKTMQKLFVKT